ncbi:hypothetical protein ACQJBY_021798 [Aegilops geniculata]
MAGTATTVFTRPMILLPVSATLVPNVCLQLHQLLDIAHRNRCYSSFRCVYQALGSPIPLVCMEYLLFATTWTRDGIIPLTVLEILL